MIYPKETPEKCKIVGSFVFQYMPLAKLRYSSSGVRGTEGIYISIDNFSSERFVSSEHSFTKLMAVSQCFELCLKVLGLSHFIEEDKNMAYTDNTTKADRYNAGKDAAETLLPFLRTDVPFRAITRLGELVGQWSGYPDNSSFTTGFLDVFGAYKEANGKPLALKSGDIVDGTQS